MTQFLHLNMPEFNEMDQDIMKPTCSRNICISCRKENTTLIPLSTCKHTSLFEFFYKYKVQFETSVICVHCHNFLMKIELFKMQVELSLDILNKQTPRLKASKITFQRLHRSKTNITSYREENVKDESFEESASTIQDHYNDVTTDIKIEHDSNSDFEIDLPLSVIKKEIKKVKKKKKKVTTSKEVLVQSQKSLDLSEQPVKSLRSSSLYDGKIAIISLSKEEMLLERDRDSKKESYLNLPYKCDDCITGFDHELTLQDHMDKRHAPKRGGYSCDICKSVLSTESSYKEHAKRHTRRYECQACGKRNNNVYSVIKHYNEEHGTIETQYSCWDCEFTTDSHRSFRYHRDKHNIKQKPQCPLCESTFVNNAGLRVHLFTVHKKSNRVYSCEQCNKVYNAKSGLVAHFASAHSGSRGGAYCAPCRTHFKTQHNLTHHLRTHSAHVSDTDKRFICDECGVKFLTKGSLQEHINFVHLKSSKHECTRCRKSARDHGRCNSVETSGIKKVFKNGSALKKHENYVHKKLRPPRNKICDHCGRGFTTLAILRCHVRTHTGERPLRCEHCAASFAHSAALYTHNKLLHNPDRQNKKL